MARSPRKSGNCTSRTMEGQGRASRCVCKGLVFLPGAEWLDLRCAEAKPERSISVSPRQSSHTSSASHSSPGRRVLVEVCSNPTFPWTAVSFSEASGNNASSLLTSASEPIPLDAHLPCSPVQTNSRRSPNFSARRILLLHRARRSAPKLSTGDWSERLFQRRSNHHPPRSNTLLSTGSFSSC